MMRPYCPTLHPVCLQYSFKAMGSCSWPWRVNELGFFRAPIFLHSTSVAFS